MSGTGPRSLRIGARRGPGIEFFFDEAAVSAFEGETVAMALWAAGIRSLRASPVAGDGRGVLCGIGSCQECAVLVYDARRESCLTLVAPGLRVRSIRPAKAGA